MIWVIGGTSGIGKEIADQLEEQEIVVHATGDLTDVRNSGVIQAEIRDVENSGYSIDGVVYSAGVSYLQWLGSMGVPGLQEAKGVVDTNLLGFISVMDALCVGDRRWQPIPVVVISSDAATRPMRTSIAYCASKAGLDMAVRCAARELGPLGWRINAVSPGMTKDTAISDYVDARVMKLRNWSRDQMLNYEERQEVVLGRVTKSEIAQVAIDTLFGPPHLNGAIIPVNGGR